MMKWGFLIAIGIVVFFGGLFWFSARGVPDRPTSATSQSVLQARTLDGLPEVYEPTEPGADANARYQALVRFYKQHEQRLESSNPPAMLTQQATEMLVKAAQAGDVDDGLLDDQIPVRPGAMPEYGAALEVLPGFAMSFAERQFDGGRVHQAIDTVLAVFTFGERLYRHSDRLYNRVMGLSMMDWSLATLTGWRERVSDEMTFIDQWHPRVTEINGAWTKKRQLVQSLRPHIGDLINIAQNDEDPTWRTEAILRLGVMKYNPGTAANQRVIHETIAAAKESDHATIARAAAAADAFSKEDLQKMR